jgi:hypothetical protein
MPDRILQGEIEDSFTLIFSEISKCKVKISTFLETPDTSDLM